MPVRIEPLLSFIAAPRFLVSIGATTILTRGVIRQTVLAQAGASVRHDGLSRPQQQERKIAVNQSGTHGMRQGLLGRNLTLVRLTAWRVAPQHANGSCCGRPMATMGTAREFHRASTHPAGPIPQSSVRAPYEAGHPELFIDAHRRKTQRQSNAQSHGIKLR